MFDSKNHSYLIDYIRKNFPQNILLDLYSPGNWFTHELNVALNTNNTNCIVYVDDEDEGLCNTILDNKFDHCILICKKKVSTIN